MTDRKAAVRKVLDQPVMGFAPWILVSVVEGPGRVALAGALGGALALLICVAGAAVGVRPKLLDVAAIIFFAALALVAALASPSTQHWLGLWSAELCNVIIAAIAGLSLAVGKPFTLQYAREQTERKYWHSALFLRINYVITAVWSAAFLLIAIVGYIGDGPLHQPDNIWTAWIIQIALIVLAIKFTGWYPDHATADPTPATAEPAPAPATAEPAPHAAPAPHAEQARHAGPAPGAAGPHRAPPLSDLLRPLAAYLVPVGILVAIVGGRLWWAGVIVIVAGVVVTRHLHRHVRRTAMAAGQAPSRQTGAPGPRSAG
jgi:magnesium-transporting ATPase (P-type)